MLISVWRRHPDELNADFARFYGVLDWRSLPPVQSASLFIAMLRQPESWTHRIMQAGDTFETSLQKLVALAVDRLGLLVWQNTKDGMKGRNRPPSMYEALFPSHAVDLSEDTFTIVDPDELDGLLKRLHEN